MDPLRIYPLVGVTIAFCLSMAAACTDEDEIDARTFGACEVFDEGEENVHYAAGLSTSTPALYGCFQDMPQDSCKPFRSLVRSFESTHFHPETSCGEIGYSIRKDQAGSPIFLATADGALPSSKGYFGGDQGGSGGPGGADGGGTGGSGGGGTTLPEGRITVRIYAPTGECASNRVNNAVAFHGHVSFMDGDGVSKGWAPVNPPYLLGWRDPDEYVFDGVARVNWDLAPDRGTFPTYCLQKGEAKISYAGENLSITISDW